MVNSVLREPLPSRHRALSTQQISNFDDLFVLSRLTAQDTCAKINSSFTGLTQDEARERLGRAGLNLVTRERKPTIAQEIWARANKKTGRPVRFELTDQTRQAIDEYLRLPEREFGGI